MTEFPRASCASADDSSSISPDSHEVACWISFGGNVGDVKATFDAALALLSLHCHIQLGRRSGIYRAAAMGSQAGTPFLNSVCELKTQLSPKALLTVLQSVETQLGRTRDVRWGPRTLDLDILNYGNQTISDPDLIVPHPGLMYRRFVLDPLVEVAPEWPHPQSSESSGRMLERLNRRPLRVCLLDASPQEIKTVAIQLGPKFPDLELLCEESDQDNALCVGTKTGTSPCGRTFVDLRHSPGDILEQLTSAFTAIFDAPERICAW